MFRISFALLVTLALTNGAPQSWRAHHGRLSSTYENSMDKYFNDDVFDTNAFFRDLGKAYDILSEFEKHFKTNMPSEEVDGENWVIKISLPNFEEKDIIVKANKGSLLIQAVHSMGGGNAQNYLQFRTLPSNIGDNGTWTYENGILKIVFPIEKTDTITEAAVEQENTDTTTEAAVEHSREEMEETTSDEPVVDADVGLQRGDSEEDNAIHTNEIPHGRIEATTHAVDLNDVVEFVPMRYK